MWPRADGGPRGHSRNSSTPLETDERQGTPPHPHLRTRHPPPHARTPASAPLSARSAASQFPSGVCR
eukprot:scaffold43170_cov44-Phaeocystis_antarctica.AAC.1